MLEDADLDAAVAEAIVSPAQAAALREIGARRTRERAIAEGHEERFRFMSGFNDFFFAVGVVLFAAGVAYFAGNSPIGMGIAAALMWSLAELLVGRLRLVLPGILLACLFVLFVLLAVPTETGLNTRGPVPPGGGFLGLGYLRVNPTKDGALALAIKALVAAAAAALYYWRFRLPFALLPLVATLLIAVLSLLTLVLPATLSTLWFVVLLLCGLAVFAAAMAFDMSDRERLTRRADCAFWLHLLAAPLIVHSLISLVTDKLVGMTASAAATIVLIIALLAVAAIAIDRRALLVSGLSYLGIVIGYAISGAAGTPDSKAAVVPATLVILGAFVLALGVGWMPLRRRVMSLLSPIVANRLPPVPASP
jgi:hypothetical protein